MQKNVTSQKMIVFAFDRTDNTPVTGDSANITANLRKDNGSAVATNDTNPTETEDGFYAFDLTQAETNADVLQGFPASTTADVQVIAVPGVIYTTPNSFGDDVIQTADNDIKISLIPTTPMRGTDSANTVVPPSVAQFDARTIPSANYFDPATDAVANVTLVSTTTTNTDMVGTDNALLAASYTAPDNASITLILADTNDLQTNQGDWLTATGFSTSAEISALNDLSFSDIWTGTLTESYAADGAAITPAQGMHMIWSDLRSPQQVSTTWTDFRLNNTTASMTFTLDDATTPTKKTRAT